MLTQAEEKFGDRVHLVQVDARRLGAITRPLDPDGGKFQLILLLNEVVNYMTEEGDLDHVFAGIRRNLSPGGLVVFDANTLLWFRESFASGRSEEMSARGWDWQGLSKVVERGGLFEAHLSGRAVAAHIHRQRHWPPEQIEQALETAGLRPVAALGQREEDWQITLEKPVDEARDSKTIHIAACPG
jgi:SAM-dependent methyltransferase